MKQSPQNNCSKMKGIETAGVPYLHQLGTQFYCICIQLWKALIISQTNLEFKKVGLDNWWARILSVPYVIAYESFYPQFSMRNQEKINSRNLTGEPQTIWSGEGRKAFDVWATEQLFTILKQNGFNKT